MNKKTGFLAYMGERRNLKWLALLAIALIILIAATLIGEKEHSQGSLESDVEELCSSVEGVGECRVMLTLGESGEVCAVAVICEGGDSVSVRYRLVELLSSLYGISTHRICVEKME